MEYLGVRIDPAGFDKAIHSGLKECADLELLVKSGAMESGAAAAVITFTVELPDGDFARVQAVTSVQNWINALSIIKGWKDGGHI